MSKETTHISTIQTCSSTGYYIHILYPRHSSRLKQEWNLEDQPIAKKLYIRITNYTFTRFLLVGGLNTAFGYSTYALLLYAGIHFSLASFISTCLGILFNFKTLGRLVFKNGSHLIFWRFVGGYLFICLVNIGCLEIFYLNKVNIYIAGAILIFPMAMLSFSVNRIFVFKKKVETEKNRV